jgi:hypothetical protein
MATFDEAYPLTDELKAHWEQLRQDRGWSWGVLADYLERYCLHDPATPNILAWVKEQDTAPKSTRGKKSGTETR